MPSNAGAAFTSVHSTAGTLTPAAGAVVFLAWVLLPLVAAAVTLNRRNA